MVHNGIEYGIMAAYGPTLEPRPRDRDRVRAGCEGHAAVSQAELLGGSQEVVVQVDSRIAGLGRK